MPDILALVASRRSLGNSDLLAREAALGAESAGARVEIQNITNLDIIPCEGCLRCVFGGKCKGQDNMDMLLQKMLQSDGLIIAAPVYLLSPASIIKRIVDRALMVSLYIDELAAKKRGALTISMASKAIWNPAGMEILNQFALAYGYPVYDYLEAYAPGPGEILLQEDIVRQSYDLGYGLVQFLNNQREARSPAPNQCPFCYSRSFRLLGDSRVQCPYCLVYGTLQDDGAVRVEEDAMQESFWTPRYRKHHLEEWIRGTRGTFVQNRDQIREKMKKYLAG